MHSLYVPSAVAAQFRRYAYEGIFEMALMVNSSRRKELDPWRVIFSFLSDLSSDQVTQIVGRTGLPVDWSLNEQESYTHKTRIRAYLLRIIEAYSMLTDEDKLRVAWIVTKGIADLAQDYPQKLNEALRAIGWKIESNKLTTDDTEVRELFFPKGAPHDAYVEIRNILKLANTAIDIIDPYVDGSIFQMLKSIPSATLSVKLLSSNLPPDFALEARKFVTQHSHISLEIRKTKEFHDRFVIVDDTRCYHIGASIKDAGGKAFMISAVEDPQVVKAITLHHKQSWDAATIFLF